MVRTVPYRPTRLTAEASLARVTEDYFVANQRRSVRMFSSDPVDRKVIEYAILMAGTAPSGAHCQPWHFSAISNSGIKQQIREAAEREEAEFYARRITPEWRKALEPLGTDFVKQHLTNAPWLIVAFRRDYEIDASGNRAKNYYMTESVGIAVGFLIQSLHRAGLATLTHTPAPMTFLKEICGRPDGEKPFVLMPIGYPANDCVVPDLGRKSLDAIAQFVE